MDICTSSFDKYPFWSIKHFLLVCRWALENFGVPYISSISPLSDIYLQYFLLFCWLFPLVFRHFRLSCNSFVYFWFYFLYFQKLVQKNFIHSKVLKYFLGVLFCFLNTSFTVSGLYLDPQTILSLFLKWWETGRALFFLIWMYNCSSITNWKPHPFSSVCSYYLC